MKQERKFTQCYNCMYHITVKFFTLLIIIIACNSIANAQIITTIIGGGLEKGEGAAAKSAALNKPSGVAIDENENIYVVDQANNKIRKVSKSGVITTIAGNGKVGYTGDGGAATAAKLNAPTGVAVDDEGNIYIAEPTNKCIRKVNTEGIISTFAGNGKTGYSGDGGQATAATLSSPAGVAVDKRGNVFIADEYNYRIRKVNKAGIITTIAGTGKGGYSGDNGLATDAKLHLPTSVFLDKKGSVYVADEYNYAIRKIDSFGYITTVAGCGATGFDGDGGPAKRAKMKQPRGVAVDNKGNVFFSDEGNNRIRKVNKGGVISTYAGDGVSDFGGDGNVGTNARLSLPIGLTTDENGILYVADVGNNRIRKICPPPMPIKGITHVCEKGATTKLDDETPDGKWSSESVLVATVSKKGLVTGVSAGITNITYTIVNSCGTDYTISTITVNPLPNAGKITGESEVCIGNNLTLSNVAAGAGTWNSSNTLKAEVNSTKGVVVSTGIGTATIAYSVTNICGTAVDNFPITVNPLPALTAVTNQTVCNNGSTAEIKFISTLRNTTYNWVNSNSLIGIGENGVGEIGTFKATNGGIKPISGTFSVTPVAKGCKGSPISFNIGVNPTPTVNSVANFTVCNGIATNAIKFTSPVNGATFTWTNSNTEIGLIASGTGNLNSFKATDTSILQITSTITVIPTANGCSGPALGFTITVNPTPKVNTITNQSICNNTSSLPINFTCDVKGASFNWTNEVVGIGLVATGTGNIAAFNAKNTGNTTITSVVKIKASANECNGPNASFIYSVFPTPTVSSVSNQTVCNGLSTTAVKFAGSVSGTEYNWINNNISIGLSANGIGNINPFIVSNCGTNPISGTIKVTPIANGCTGLPTSFAITVNPTPVVNSITNQILCNGTSTTEVKFAGNIKGTVYNWANENASIGLVAMGNGNISSFTTKNTSALPIISIVKVTPTALGCNGPQNSFAYIVNPTPTVKSIFNQVVCNGSPLNAINFTGSVTGAEYNWITDNKTIGIDSNGNGNISVFNVKNEGNKPIISNIKVTPSAYGCIGSSTSFAITVNPTPKTDSLPDLSLCNGIATTAIKLKGQVGSTVHNWVNSNKNIGLDMKGADNINSFTPVNNEIFQVTSTIKITPTAYGCTGPTTSFTITVNPTPTINSFTNQLLCNGSETKAINFKSNVTATEFMWVNNNPSIGLDAKGSGNIASFKAKNSSTAPIVGDIKITPVAYGCSGTATSFTISINPTPTVNKIANEAVCHKMETRLITFTGSVPGTTYTWFNDNKSIGLDESGTGNIVPFEAKNSKTSRVTANITVTPKLNGCIGESSTFELNVNPLPTVNSVSNQAVCNGASTTAINFTGSVMGTDYSWVNNNSSIGLAAKNNGNIESFKAINLDSKPIISTIKVMPIAHGCDGTPISFAISVNPTPTVNSVTNQTISDGASTQPISFTGSVTGTTYVWVNDNIGIGIPALGNGNIPSFKAKNNSVSPIVSNIKVTPNANGCVGQPTSFEITVNPSQATRGNSTGSKPSTGGK